MVNVTRWDACASAEGAGQCVCKTIQLYLKDHGDWGRFLRTEEGQCHCCGSGEDLGNYRPVNLILTPRKEGGTRSSLERHF